MHELANQILRQTWAAIGGIEGDADRISFTGDGALPSLYAVTDFAAATIATAALAMHDLLRLKGPAPTATTIDRRLASFWFGFSIRPIEWELPPIWDPIAGDYRTADGWIKLHTNAPHHRAACESVLGAHPDRDSVAAAVARWSKGDLESAIVETGGCAAEMRRASEWAEHPQGRAVDAEPLVHLGSTDSGPAASLTIEASRPLQGIKVLDLTRVLAGPVASRFLAGYGAEVLRLDPPGWEEGTVIPEVTLGKRCARLDLRRDGDRALFKQLLSEADVFMHGYRPGALDALGFDSATRRALSPGLIDVCLCAYGWSGPWASRRGFDSLVQMSSGMADAGMRWRKADQPVPLPVQALDHATGYLMAAAAIRGITNRLTSRHGTEARLSLARTAKLLKDIGTDHSAIALAPETPADLCSTIEETDWGPARRLNPPVTIDGTPMRWDHPAHRLGTSAPHWVDY